MCWQWCTYIGIVSPMNKQMVSLEDYFKNYPHFDQTKCLCYRPGYTDTLSTTQTVNQTFLTWPLSKKVPYWKLVEAISALLSNQNPQVMTLLTTVWTPDFSACQESQWCSIMTTSVTISHQTHFYKDHMEDFLMEYLTQPQPEPPLPFKLAEIQYSISHPNLKLAPGPDLIGPTPSKTPQLLSHNITCPQLSYTHTYGNKSGSSWFQK